jgi:hypothetical protein
LYFLSIQSLSYAKVLEDVVEGLLAGDSTAGNFAENLEHLAEVLCHKVGGE